VTTADQTQQDDDLTAVRLNVNGREVQVRVGPFESLADVLRNRLELTGTKIGCASGECGACTVILDGQAVPSCVTLAALADGKAVRTVEGLAEDGEPTPLQRSFLEAGAFQCGFCTAGMLMSATALLESNPRPTEEEIRRGLQGNICRCTGYVQIIQAVQEASVA
jgi:carbon-monoxide dehydrogenase small subunit